MDVSFTKEIKLIKEERVKCTFSIPELTTLLDGGRHKTKLRHDIGKSVSQIYCSLQLASDSYAFESIKIRDVI